MAEGDGRGLSGFHNEAVLTAAQLDGRKLPALWRARQAQLAACLQVDGRGRIHLNKVPLKQKIHKWPSQKALIEPQLLFN